MGRQVLRTVAIGSLLAALAVFILLGYRQEWQWTGFPPKKLFDWMQILVIPVAVAIGTFVLNRAAKRRDDEAQREQRQREEAIEARHADFDRGRQQRADYAQFITNMLNDLKAVNDRVERVRILLPAHQSALTYGNEMRDIIESRVQLLGVIRALELDPYGSSLDIAARVTSMEEYLKYLIKAFQRDYKKIADLQKVQETLTRTQIQEQLKKTSDIKSVSLPDNTTWEELNKLPEVQEFLSDEDLAGQNRSYRLEFKQPLDDATKILRQKLRELL
jgi:hypothetical protein